MRILIYLIHLAEFDQLNGQFSYLVTRRAIRSFSLQQNKLPKNATFLVANHSRIHVYIYMKKYLQHPIFYATILQEKGKFLLQKVYRTIYCFHLHRYVILFPFAKPPFKKEIWKRANIFCIHFRFSFKIHTDGENVIPKILFQPLRSRFHKYIYPRVIHFEVYANCAI